MDYTQLLNQEPRVWNEWRDENPSVYPDLSREDLTGKDLRYRNFNHVNFRESQLSDARFDESAFSSADLTNAQMRGVTLNRAYGEWVNFTGACLDKAQMIGSCFEKSLMSNCSMRNVNASNASFESSGLMGADLQSAYLASTSFLRSDLRQVNLSHARFGLTVLVDTNLFGAKGLDSCEHSQNSFSFVDHRTIAQSGEIDVGFLLGCGLPLGLATHYVDLAKGTVRYSDCFISCSEADIDFAERLRTNLEGNGVKCWLYKHDMPWGARLWDTIDNAISANDKFLLILSKNSIHSEWVEDEVTKAFSEERRRKRDILLPLRLDDEVMDSSEPWATKLRDSRNIADFREWGEPDKSRQLLDNLLNYLLPKPKKHQPVE